MRRASSRPLATSRSAGRVVALTLAAMVMTTLTPPASAQIGERDISEPPDSSACPVDPEIATVVPEDGFTDVSDGNVHELAVDCVVWYGVATGTSDTTYGPGDPVRREQMASFVARLLDYVSDEDHAGAEGPGPPLPAAPGTNQFPCDVNPVSAHYDAIQRLAAAGIVQGTGTDAGGEACFDPGREVTRGQAATFMWKALVHSGAAPDVLPDVLVFSDLAGDIHGEPANSLGILGIARGAGTDENGQPRYLPGLDVRRDQTASFVARTLDLLVEEGVAVPPPAA